MEGASEPKTDPMTWPKGVTGISFANIARLGVGEDDRLYWDGRPVLTERRFRLSLLQTIGAVLVGLATIIGGVGTGLDEGFDFGCKLHWWSSVCPK